MADKERPLMIRHTDGRSYTLAEYQAILAPLYAEKKDILRRCIAGLNSYAAGLAVTGRESELQELRKFVVEAAAFWVLNGDDSKNGYWTIKAEYEGAFDQAVAAARSTGQAPILSREAQGSILSGLELYSKEMTDSGGMERWVRQCDALAEQLREEWAVPEARMGGLTYR